MYSSWRRDNPGKMDASRNAEWGPSEKSRLALLRPLSVDELCEIRAHHQQRRLLTVAEPERWNRKFMPDSCADRFRRTQPEIALTNVFESHDGAAEDGEEHMLRGEL